jgi:hypothetical protein
VKLEDLFGRLQDALNRSTVINKLVKTLKYLNKIENGHTFKIKIDLNY